MNQSHFQQNYKNLILAIDQGTTSTTALLIETDQYTCVAKETVEVPNYFPTPSFVEQDGEEIWNTVKLSVSNLLLKNGINPYKIAAIGITNQRETIIPFHKFDGAPLSRALVWQDKRTSEDCAALVKNGNEKWIKAKTGLPIDPYFSATKIKWLLENNNQVAVAAKNETLSFGTIDTFLLYRLTNGESYFTDATNASRYLLLNLSSGTWDQDLLKFFDIEEQLLPKIKDSFGLFGVTKGLDFLPDNIPITSILGDQQASLFGQKGTDNGNIKCTYGTGAFVLLNTGSNQIHSKSGLLTTIAYKHDGKISYALEGCSYIAGAAVQWLRDKLGIITSAAEVEILASHASVSIDDMEELFFFPFFSGIGSPYWKSNAKAMISGMTRDTSKYHIARACLEGIAFSINDLFLCFKHDLGMPFENLYVDGGATANNLLLQIQSDISSTPVVRPQIIETTAYGAALGAAVGLGYLTLPETKMYWKEDKVFTPAGETKVKDYYFWKNKIWKENISRFYL